MPKGSKKDWLEVLSKLYITSGTVKPVSDLAIRHFEESTHFRLPSSYRNYCKSFGAGFLTSPVMYEILVPGAKYERFNLEYHNPLFKKYFDKNIFSNPEQFDRAYFFGRDVNRSQYFWDPGDVVKSSAIEYAVYMVSDDSKIYRLTNTFWDFVNVICLQSGPPDYENYQIEMVFEPSEGR